MNPNISEASMEELFWQLKALASEPEQAALLDRIRSERLSVADALSLMLRNEDKAAGFMNLADAPGEASQHDPTLDTGNNPSDSRLEATCDSQPSVKPTTQSQLGHFPKQIGPYELLEPIGEGGMGVVFLAQQSQPVRRKVALKIIKPGMDSRQVIARFEAERQALAMMDHPHIAKVLDAGTTETGLPFFVMELVRGIPITDYCDQLKMTIRQRLQLFRDACEAIQHAHNKGIIHRDIKPSNVLVTEQDGKAVVKVIDFGVAKALTDNLTDKTLFTGMFQLMGTPLYMSPEQASLSGVDVDVRSDVYSLGVMLYELLSGLLPVDREAVKDLSFEKLRERICETEPPKPSKRLSTLKDVARETVAERRGANVAKLDRLVSNELDWIVMRSLEKDRSRRYQSAREFSEDIGRYISGDTVEACPPSTFYKLQKLYRKNRSLVAAAGIVFLALTSATVFSSWQAWQATLAQQEAEWQAGRADKEAENAKAKADEANAVTNFMVNRLFASAVPGEATSPDLTIGEVLNNAEKDLSRAFKDQPLVEAWVRSSLANIYSRLGLFENAIEQVNKAIGLRTPIKEKNDEVLLSLRTMRAEVTCLGKQDFGSAAQELQDVIRICETHSSSIHEHVLFEAKTSLGRVLIESGNIREGILLLEPTIEEIKKCLGYDDSLFLRSATQIASGHWRLGEKSRAIEILKEAVANVKSSTLETDSGLVMQFDLAMYLVEQQPEEAIEILQTCAVRIKNAYGIKSLFYAKLIAVKAQAEWRLGRKDAAEQNCKEAIRIAESIPNAASSYVDQFRQVYADFLMEQERYSEAKQIYSRSLQEAQRTLRFDHPDCIRLIMRIAGIERLLGNYDAYFEETTSLLSQLEKSKGVGSNIWREVAGTLAANLIYKNRWDSAEPLCLKIKDCGLRPSDAVLFTDGTSHLISIFVYEELVEHYLATGRYSEAELLMTDFLKALHQDANADAVSIWVARRRRAEAIVAQKRFDEGLDELEQVLQFAIEKNLNDRLDYTRSVLRQSYEACVLWTAFEAPVSERDTAKALAAAKKTLEYDPPQKDRWMLGLMHCEVGEFDEAVQLFQKVAAEEEQPLGNASFRFPMAVALAEIGEIEAAKECYHLGFLGFITSWKVDPWVEKYRGLAANKLSVAPEEAMRSALVLAIELTDQDPENLKNHIAVSKVLWLQFLQSNQTADQTKLATAIDRMRQLTELKQQTRVSFGLFPLLLIANDRQAYKDELGRLLDFAQEEKGVLTADQASHIVRFACLLDEIPSELVADLAEVAVWEDQPKDYQLSAKALFELRSGRFDQAIEWLENAMAIDESKNTPQFSAMLAVAYAEQGDVARAREFLTQSKLERSDLELLDVHQIVEWVFYRREAMRLLQEVDSHESESNKAA